MRPACSGTRRPLRASAAGLVRPTLQYAPHSRHILSLLHIGETLIKSAFDSMHLVPRPAAAVLESQLQKLSLACLRSSRATPGIRRERGLRGSNI